MGVMDERSSRIFVGVCLLVLLWIGTYWVYEPGRPATGAEVSFAEPSGPVDLGPGDGGVVAIDPPDPDPRPGPVVRPRETPAPVVEDKPEPPPEGLRVVPPEFRDYVIRPGDTLESIARSLWGDSGLWPAIARSNPLKDPRRLAVGETIRVPVDPENIQGRVVAGEGAAPASTPTADPGWVEYTVQPGDSLTRIARSYYGSVRFADAIFEANRETLSSPDALRVGQVLRLPPTPAGED